MSGAGNPGLLLLTVGALWALLLMTPPCLGQKSVVFVHGILSDQAEFDTSMRAWVQKDFPNISTFSLDAYSDLASLRPMWEQVAGFTAKFTPIVQNSPEGITLICYSQGGVICRALLSTLPHNVHTLITLSSPLAGQFGDTTYLKLFFKDIVKEEAYKVLYSKEGQDISVANYWNDPHQHQLYLKENHFLSVLNNETLNLNSLSYKSNFLRLQQLVLVGGPQDEIIGPWQSSHFGFYDDKEVVQPMTNQSWYQHDSFGLRTLNEQKRIKTYTVPNVRHTHWYRTLSVYQECVKPWISSWIS